MLIVLAKAKLGEGMLDKGREAIAAMVEASNAEEGCIAYSFTVDVLDPTTLHIVEKWVDDAALKAHFQTPHMAAFNAAVADLDLSVVEAIRFETDEGTSLF